MTKPYLLQLRAGAEGLYGESVRSGTNRRGERKKKPGCRELRGKEEDTGGKWLGGRWWRWRWRAEAEAEKTRSR